MEQESVLITGGSGLIGKYLTSLLIEKGYRVSHLSRNARQSDKVTSYAWDPVNGIIDPAALNGIDYIVHLSGTNIGQGRWTTRRKEEIIKSRINSADLLFRTISSNNLSIKAFISASAIGYYGSHTSDRIYVESDAPGDDFLGSTCRVWEEAAGQFERSGIRTVRIRTGVVLEKRDGALSRFLAAARFGLFPVIGNGRQYLPWIHIGDLCSIYLKALDDGMMNGAYNAVSPGHITNREFMKTLAMVMNKPFIHPMVPAVFLKIIMGESSVFALEGSRISSEKIIQQGYLFRFMIPEEALRDVLSR
jgi:uncharacterized protein (TIGR01777 family)